MNYSRTGVGHQVRHVLFGKFIVHVRSCYMSGCSIEHDVQNFIGGAYIPCYGIQKSTGAWERSHQRHFLIVFKLEMLFQREPLSGRL